jgi:hypothetical protein
MQVDAGREARLDEDVRERRRIRLGRQRRQDDYIIGFVHSACSAWSAA